MNNYPTTATTITIHSRRVLKVGRKKLKLIKCLRHFTVLWTVYFIAWMLTLDTVHYAEILFKSRCEKCDSPLSQKYNEFSLSGDQFILQ